MENTAGNFKTGSPCQTGLDRKGTIPQYAFVDISGNKIFDQSVRDLLNELDKLLPLPEEFEGALTEIGINFKPR